jgi:signal peptidase I
MGDNTRNSFDSRFWGGVPIGNLIGRGEVVWWPLGDLRPIR